MLEPLHQIRCRIKLAHVQVSWPITEPAPHLHQGIVHLGGSEEVAYTEPLQRKSPSQLVATDSYHFQSGGAVRIIEDVLRRPIDQSHLDYVQHLHKSRLYFAP